jgi:hypothetical protein
LRSLNNLANGQPSSIAMAIEVPRGAVVEAFLEGGFAVFSINPKQLDRAYVSAEQDLYRSLVNGLDSGRSMAEVFHPVKEMRTYPYDRLSRDPLALYERLAIEHVSRWRQKHEDGTLSNVLRAAIRKDLPLIGLTIGYLERRHPELTYVWATGSFLYSGSRRAFLRLRLRANACLTRSFWPGFR